MKKRGEEMENSPEFMTFLEVRQNAESERKPWKTHLLVSYLHDLSQADGVALPLCTLQLVPEVVWHCQQRAVAARHIQFEAADSEEAIFQSISHRT